MSKSIKLISFFLTLTLILNSFVILSSAEVSEFYINEAVIIISENPSITDKYAAGRLKYYLDEITGEVITDDILNNIFDHFCIGK